VNAEDFDIMAEAACFSRLSISSLISPGGIVETHSLGGDSCAALLSLSPTLSLGGDVLCRTRPAVYNNIGRLYDFVGLVNQSGVNSVLAANRGHNNGLEGSQEIIHHVMHHASRMQILNRNRFV